MTLAGYSARLAITLWLYVTMLAPTTRPHLTLLTDFPYHGLPALLFAFPIVAVGVVIASTGSPPSRRFPDLLAALCLLTAAVMTYGLALLADYPVLNFQLLAIPLFAGLAMLLHRSHGFNRGTA